MIYCFVRYFAGVINVVKASTACLVHAYTGSLTQTHMYTGYK